MKTTDQTPLKHAIACADIFELLSIAFSFPDESFARALLDGSFNKDLRVCLGELDLLTDRVGYLDKIRSSTAAAVDADERATTLLSALRREYSRLFLTSGKCALIFPYEAAFRHVAMGREGMPSLFIAQATNDVERHMSLFGALPHNARQEPVDSMHRELEFLHFLYTGLATSLFLGDEASIAVWQREIAGFRQDHVDHWLLKVMLCVQEETISPIYRALSQVTGFVLNATATAAATKVTATTGFAPERQLLAAPVI